MQRTIQADQKATRTIRVTTVSILLAFFLIGGDVRTSVAAGETTYVTDTSITINGIGLKILAGSTARAVNYGASQLTVTAGTGNSLTLQATDSHTSLQNDGGLPACGSGNAQLTVSSGVVVISPSATGCPLPTPPEPTPTVTNSPRVSGGGAPPPSIQPTALSSRSGAVLSFTVNNGAPTTTNPNVTLNLNADPRTVKGYVVSLDPTFAQTGIVNYSTTTPAIFTLPNTAGSYTIYLKYYSTTGLYSAVFSQKITYLVQTSGVATAPQKAVSPPSVLPLFTRTLKLGSRGTDVQALQVFLNTHGFRLREQGQGASGQEGLVYGSLTAKAVSKFQEAHASEVLAPFQLKKGTGVFGTSTIQAVNKIRAQG